MGISKKMQMEEMHRVSTEEYDEDAEFDVIEDDADFDEKCEDAAIEKQIEDELQTLNELEADMSTVQKAAYAHLSERMTMAKERVVLIKNILSDYKYEVSKNG